MRRIITALLALMLLFSCAATAYAAESSLDDEKNTTEVGVYAKYVSTVEGEYSAPINNGTSNITTDDGITVTVTGAPSGAVRLVVVPVPTTETEAWEWITACMEGTGTAIHTFAVYFEDQDGSRSNANGATVTIDCSHCSAVPMVCSLTTGGAVQVLNTADSSVTFTTNGSTYYVMAEKTTDNDDHNVTVKDPEGGDVEISDPTPETGDTVTITPTPDEGKEVDEVIVKDEDGNPVPVTDNGDGTYSYEQPDGDVTIEVTFKDEEPTPAEEHKVTVEKTSGGKVEISDDTPVTGQTVTITPKPNSGKVVDKVTVTDEDGKAVKVKDNGDGTYSFEQPNGDVTVKVTFKNKPSSGDIPQTGDTMHLHLWLFVFLISGIALIITGKKLRKQDIE